MYHVGRKRELDVSGTYYNLKDGEIVLVAHENTLEPTVHWPAFY